MGQQYHDNKSRKKISEGKKKNYNQTTLINIATKNINKIYTRNAGLP